MPRTVDSATKTALASSSFRMCHLLQIDFDSIVRLTDNSYAVNYGGQTYSPTGHLLNLGSTEESQELRVGQFAITLSGVSQEYISVFLGTSYVNRRVQMYLAVLDNSGSVTGDAIKTFDGQISSFTINDNEATSTIQVKVASHWADFESKAGRVTNQNSQQFYFPNDTGMRFAAESIRDIKWGRA